MLLTSLHWGHPGNYLKRDQQRNVTTLETHMSPYQVPISAAHEEGATYDLDMPAKGTELPSRPGSISEPVHSWDFVELWQATSP